VSARRPARVVSLCPSLSELVWELGAGALLVGRTRFCVAPAELRERVPAVGGTKDPSLARIAELAPDLVLMNEEENRREDGEALRARGIALATFFPQAVEDVPPMVRRVGALLGAEPAAEALAAAIEERAAEVARRAVGAGLTFVYVIWRRPWMTVTPGTYVASLLARTGARNAVPAGPVRYPEIGAAEIARLAPDRVLLSSEPYPFRPAHAADLARESGLDPGRIRLVDGAALSWHGARTLAGLAYAESILGPDARSSSG